MTKVKVDIDTAKVKRRFEKEGDVGMLAVRNQIVKDSEPFVPMRSGDLKNSVIPSISKLKEPLIYRKPYAKFQFGGKVMVGVHSKKAWANEGEVKVVTDKDLSYSIIAHPKAGPKWFERAKALYLKNWLSIVKKGFSK